MNYVFNQFDTGAQVGRLDFITRNARGLDVQVFIKWRRNTLLLADPCRGWVKVSVYRPGYLQQGYVGKSECGLGDAWDLEKGLEVAWGRLEAHVPEALEQNEDRLYKPLTYRTQEALALLKDLKRAVWAYLFEVDIEKVSLEVTFGEVNKWDLRSKDLWINALLTVRAKLQAEVADLKAKAQDDADLFEDQLAQKDLQIVDLQKQLANERKLFSEQGVKIKQLFRRY